MRRVFTPVKKKTILIVDDDLVALNIYREQFQRHGFKVEIAENGDDAGQRIRSEPVDLVIFDLCLPELDGAEQLKNIRSEFDAQRLPIIAFSNSYLGSLGRAASEAGATKCVVKSECTPSQLLELVRELLGGGPAGAGATEAESETQLQEALVRTVFANALETLAKLRTSHQVLAKAEPASAGQAELGEMHRQLRSIPGSIAFLGFQQIAQMTNGLEALLIELRLKPEKISASVVRTIAQAIDTLASLFDQAADSRNKLLASPNIVIVDDEIISRETISSALAKAGLRAVSVDDPLAAQRLLGEERFDLIFLDVEMPGQSGLDLCIKIREMATNRSTPVVFVTSHSDFGSRAQSTLSGGNDFIAKPFLLVELAVKALTWLFRKTAQPPENAPSTAVHRELPPLIEHRELSIHEG